MTLRQERDEYLDRIRDLVKRYGWAIQGVLPDETTPGFSYTVGLALTGHAEILIAGLPHQTAQTILNDLAQRVRDTGEDIPVGAALDDVLQGYPVKTIEVAEPWEHLTIAQQILAEQVAHSRITAVQVVWPDADGKFPWDPASRVAGQTLYGEPPA